MQTIHLKAVTNQEEPITITALVISEQPTGYIVKADHDQYVVKQAVSCLVKPAVGDTVMLYMDVTGKGYILSILERMNQQSTRISVENDLVIESRNDTITLAARESIDLASADRVSITAQDMVMTGHRGMFQINKVDLVSDTTTVHTKSSRMFANSIETVANTLTQRLQNSFRYVEKIEQLNAGNLMQSIRSLMSVKARQAVVIAEQDVKIDGERIHMG